MKKQKLKTPKTLIKRIRKVTKKGKIIVGTTSAQHLASNKSKRRRKNSKRNVLLSKSDTGHYKKFIK